MEEKARINVITGEKSQVFWALPGQDLWSFLAAHNFINDDNNNCGGRGYCGKCKIKVEGKVNDLTSTEKEKLLPDEIRKGIRLACHCRIAGEVSVYVEEKNAEFRLSDKAPFAFSPEMIRDEETVKVVNFFIPGLDDLAPSPIYDRLVEAWHGYKLDLTMDNLNHLLLFDRAGRPAIELKALVFDNRVVKRIDKKIEGVYGLALDLGTTSLFAALVDLEKGEIKGVISRTNMQRIYGADIISRVSYCLEKEDGLNKMHRILINNINSMIKELAEEENISTEQIYKITAAGNPVMLHFLAGLSVRGFAAAPYAGIFKQGLKLEAWKLGINVNMQADLFILPQVGGFVGGDTVACILSLEPDPPARYLLVDIGTNGEVVLACGDRMWAASAAAGPAFEGGNITSGGRAEEGSINKFYLDEEENLRFTFIGEGQVKNICGSAVIDLVSCLLTAGYIDNRGIITEKARQRLKVTAGSRGSEIVICDDIKMVRNNPLVFNQEDIRQVQLAKGAIRTAIDILMHKAGISEDDLDYILLAGTFGSYLNPTNCIKIGLLPGVEVSKIKNIGNAAAKGAIMALVSSKMLKKAEEIKGKVEYVELAREADFEERFINNLDFDVRRL
ncbi:Uncharacterized 2Fe-2 and 4Fe-4S clusters-containing protein, contains DUF4445 domain [Thermosyntropha lipolytica DSM 11003]|uniref:Uncharacterized 2Fe-2 and 4Fe-4S clusters-containing protein, contains DUF4445 domain n=1 Tax=Thermosyntropha lipolytica DSM 11003 TaxID=1123382 RepID=A0A1M5NFQ2_9FIRM|nr:ASKHA domain-containing protein [Thermosyntropha lipolytica]SHG87793.1 Uncharacterized 2Fe-2 and 4Fe-4S clusters-containing protein, contains DUF4445 domain [Thermosyntropha lipolytica DSM 11003]